MLTPTHKPTSMQDWRLETNSVQSRWLLATGEGNYKIPPNVDFNYVTGLMMTAMLQCLKLIQANRVYCAQLTSWSFKIFSFVTIIMLIYQAF